MKAKPNLEMRKRLRGCFASRFWVLVAVISGLCINPVFSSFAENQRYVEIHCDLDLISYAKHDSKGVPIVKRRTCSQKCIVGTNEWRIEPGFLPNVEQICYYDGTNVFYTLRATNEAAYSAAKEAVRNMKNPPILVSPKDGVSNLTVNVIPSPGGYPLTDLGVNVPWLAFCSGSYLSRTSRVVPLPTAIVSSARDAFAYKDVTKRFDDPFGLPISMDLLTSKEQYIKGLADERNFKNSAAGFAKRDGGLAPAYDDGIVKFHYEVLQSTNLGGWHFPTEFRFMHYQPDSKGRWALFVAGEGKVTFIRDATGIDRKVFDTNTPQFVNDFRFKHPTRMLDSLTYSMTNDTLPSVNDARMQAKFDRVASMMPLDKAISRQKLRIIFGVFVVGLALIPMAVYWRGRSKEMQQSKTINKVK